ncbi:MAG: hypothetical protein ABIS46_04045 [Sphingomicrobium sp.]
MPADRAEAANPSDVPRRIEALIKAIEAAGEHPAAASARELVTLLLDLHGDGLTAIMSVLAASPGSEAIIAKLDGDEQARALLLLHGLHPDDTETRVRRAVERLRPHLGVDGIRIEVEHVAAGTARLSVSDSKGAINGARQMLLPVEIEQIVFDAAPEIERVVIGGLEPAQPALAAG